jgi:hypothetical protein
MTPRPSRHRSRRPPSVPSGQIRVSIERLALHGFTERDARRVAAAMEEGLSRLVSRPGQVFVPLHVPVGPPVHYEPSRDPERSGRAAAQALWSGISGFEGETP